MPDDIVPELLPADGDELTLDDELAQLGFPDENVPVVLSTTTIPFGRTLAFDWETGTVVRHGGSPAWVYGVEAVKQVLQMALRVRRYEHPAFPEDFGMEEPDRLVGLDDDAERQAEYVADVRETILAAHERVTDVGTIRTTLLDDDTGGIFLHFAEAILDDGQTIPIENVPIGTYRDGAV